MELTKERKQHIDSLSYEGLLSRWRFARIGDLWFQGETGRYWVTRMKEKREEEPDGGSGASKRIGWER